jgi:hypothetical protein
MRQVHRGGERMYVDYSGKKARVVEPSTGELHEVAHFGHRDHRNRAMAIRRFGQADRSEATSL